MNAQLKLIYGETKPSNIVTRFDDVIGQERALLKLKFFMETHSDETPLPTLLFTGSHGLGKTYVAKRLAKNMGRRFVEVNCGVLDKADELFEEVLYKQVHGNAPVTLFFDESHRLSSEITTALLSMLNPSDSMKNVVQFKGLSILFDMSKINVIFATTDAHKMFGPLVNRCQKIYFDSYEKDELIAMLKMYCPEIEEFKCDHSDLSHACRGRGRDTFVIAQNINRYMHQKRGNDVFTKSDWSKFKNIFEIYHMGLNRQELEMLKIVKKAGSISSGNIALAMMINTDNVESELETRPRELGLIKSTSRGRTLTAEGEKYMEKI